LRLSEVHGAGPFAGHHVGQVDFLLFVRSAFLDRLGRAARQARIHREGHVGRGAHLKERHGDNAGQALPAPLLGSAEIAIQPSFDICL